jgi:DNA-directed RNA polymerase specialized sigma24 family protein
MPGGNGNGHLWSLLAERYGRDIRREARRNRPGILDAEDVTHEVLIRLHHAVTAHGLNPDNRAHCRQTIKSRAVDVSRRELRACRFTGSLPEGGDLDELPAGADRRPKATRRAR